MDKIITINLGGYAIKMEEDAYEALKPYIRQIEEAFANTENGKEIINDIEARIAEMLMERTEGKVSATIEDVDYVKKAMGNPGEFEENEQEPTTKHHTQTQDTVRKRLYRDTDNKILGGVCSGVSNYFNLDSSIVRLVWVFLFFFFGTGLLIYLILWIVVPEAVTTAQKLEMKGEAPTLDNIINKVKSEAGKVEQSLKSQNFGQKLTDILTSLSPILLVILKVFALAFGVFLLVILSSVLIALIAGTGSFVLKSHGSGFHFLPNFFDAGWEFMTVKTLIALFIGIPLFSILAGILKFVFNSKVNFKPIRVVLGWIWVATIPLLIYFVSIGVKNFRTHETLNREETFKVQQNFIIKTTFSDEDDFFDRINIQILPSEDSLVHVLIEESASGHNSTNARKNAEKIEAGVSLTGNELVLKTSDYYEKTGLFRRQDVDFTIKIPHGKKFILHKSLEDNNTSVEGINRNYYVSDSRENNKSLVFLNQELYCPTCPDSIPVGSSSVMDNRNFKQIEVEGWIEVEIKRGNIFNIQKIGPSGIIRHLDIYQSGDVLNITMEHGYFNLRTKPKVIITMPELTDLKLSGASECKSDLFAGNNLYVELNGASSADLQSEFEEIRAELTGASRLNLSGLGKNLDVDISGASHFNSEKMSLETVRVEANGASEAILGISKSINGNLSGASRLEYAGNPSLQVSNNGMSKVKQSHQ